MAADIRGILQARAPGPAVKAPPGPTMGMRGPTMSFGNGAPSNRQYTPNPFMQSGTAQGMQPPQTGMAPPQRVPMPMPQGGPMPQGVSPQGGMPNEAMIAALRQRGGMRP